VLPERYETKGLFQVFWTPFVGLTNYVSRKWGEMVKTTTQAMNQNSGLAVHLQTFFYQASLLSVSWVESYLLYIKNPDDYLENINS
jgi:hypothetical protein